MSWRVWAFLAGLPVGALAACVVVGLRAPAAPLAIGAGGGGVALLVWASALARGAHADRSARLAVAASSGWVALPGLAAIWLRVGPAPAWLLGVTLVLLAGVMTRAARRAGVPTGTHHPAIAAAVAIGSGTGALVIAGIALAAWSTDEYRVSEERAAAIFDIDAAVATQALPRCSATPNHVGVLLDRGARPRLSADGARLWFDAPVEGGGRQVHVLERDSGRLECWTCDERGNNWRPSPADRGSAVAFETDRYASGWDPTNTEIHLIRGTGRPTTSRRLTYHPGPDSHGLLRAAHQMLVWSRHENGRYAVVSAAMRRAHGGLNLGRVTVLASAGPEWMAPLAWSPDGRSLILIRGNPFRPVSGQGMDPATGARSDLGSDLTQGGAAFSGDGGWLAVAVARRGRVAGLLPGALGFLIAPAAVTPEREQLLYRGTGIRVGEPWAPGAAIDLGAAAEWGEPTGLAMAPDGATLLLGQRRATAGGVEERLLEIALGCGR